MWTLKNTKVARLSEKELTNMGVPAAQLPGRSLQLHVQMTFANGSEEKTVGTFVSTEAEVKTTVQQQLAKLNDQENLMAKIADGTFDPVGEETTPEKTEEQIAQESAELAKATWQAKRQALKQMREDMMEAKDLGVDPTPEQIGTMKALAEWVRDNATEEFYT
jgi:hypothetical protein